MSVHFNASFFHNRSVGFGRLHYWISLDSRSFLWEWKCSGKLSLTFRGQGIHGFSLHPLQSVLWLAWQNLQGAAVAEGALGTQCPRLRFFRSPEHPTISGDRHPSLDLLMGKFERFGIMRSIFKCWVLDAWTKGILPSLYPPSGGGSATAATASQHRCRVKSFLVTLHTESSSSAFWPLLTQAMVLGIWGSLVVWCRLWRVLGWSSLTEVRTFALPAIVFILEEFREEEELGVRNVPEGLSEFSWNQQN